MMKYLFIAIFTLISVFSFAQKKQNTYYFDANDEITFIKEKVSYFRVIQEPGAGSPYFKMQEFYNDNTTKRLGLVSSYEPNLKFEETLISYFPNGKKSLVENYKKNKLINFAYHYYHNGKIKEQRDYLDYLDVSLKDAFFKYKTIQVLDSSGRKLLDENGSGIVNITDTNGDSEAGAYVNGIKDGIWTSYNSALNERHEDVYADGKYLKGKTIRSNGIAVEYEKFTQLPEFTGGSKVLGKYLGQNLRYPPAARENGIQGKVTLGFVVQKDGSLTDFKIITGVSKELDDEALRVIKLSPKWNPGMIRDKPIKVSYTLPVWFKLSSPSTKF
jgi:TonB family protein